jgi:hypothetical protein
MSGAGSCTGAEDCTVAVHVHGCYADKGACDAPEEHHPKPMAIAVMASKDERDHIDMLRRQSYELAVERGHMRRG